MTAIVVGIAFLAGLLMSWIIGATGASPSFGPVNSVGAVSIFSGSFVVGIAAFLGAVTQGDAVAATMRSGIISGITIDPLLASLVLVVASLLMVASIVTQYPMPTVFTVVGGVIGAGIAAGGSLIVPTLQKVGLFWVAIPFVALGMGYGTAWTLRRYVPKTDRTERYIDGVLIVLAAYTAYTAGANQAGLAVGPLQNAADVSILYLLVFSGAGMTLGAWTGSPRMIEAVARDYSRMGPRRAIAALVAASSLAQVATVFGVPVSFNEAIVSAVIGAGLVEGTTGISTRKIGWTVIGWIGAFIVATAVTYVLTATALSL
jgi:PiT family inorganic phosphate transporter